jgi:hypothetical protein
MMSRAIKQSIKARMHKHPSQLQKMRLIAADLERFEIEATARIVAAGQDTIEHVNLRRRGDGSSP